MAVRILTVDEENAGFDGIRLNIAFSYSSHAISSEIYYGCLSPMTGKSEMHMHYMEKKSFYVFCRPHI